MLESGELHLEWDKEGALVARYYDHVAPLSPETADEIWAIAGRRGTNVDETLVDINADRDRVDHPRPSKAPMPITSPRSCSATMWLLRCLVW